MENAFKKMSTHTDCCEFEILVGANLLPSGGFKMKLNDMLAGFQNA
jgi:hypothetical protein